MRATTRRTALPAVALAALSFGCAQDSVALCADNECVAAPDATTGNMPDGSSANDGGSAACDPDAAPTESCAVGDMSGTFVAASGSDTTGAGTKELPFATIGKGASGAKSAGLANVYVCGTLTAPETIDSTMDGLRVTGGFDCATWAWTASKNSVVAPAGPGIALTVTGLIAGITFSNFELDSAPALANSGDSVLTVLVNESTNVVFLNTTINASAGAAAAAGTAVTNYTAALAAPGNPATGSTQGSSVQCACMYPTGAASVGGRGGAGDTSSPVGGAPGNATPPISSAAANGGSPGAGCTTGAGGSGVGGAAGAAGTGSALSLTVTPTGLGTSGGIGGSGGPGGVGQGGGGGGGGKEPVAADGGTSGGGGSGGCGGCGGGYGTGGAAGGSSVALASRNSAVTLSGCSLTAGAGGPGGAGGAGQLGQGGGLGANGSIPGCPGGTGGPGGPGGPGAGGAGGDSIGVVYTGKGQAPTLSNGTQIKVGLGGSGGPAGTEGSAQDGGVGLDAGAQAGPAGTTSSTPVLVPAAM